MTNKQYKELISDFLSKRYVFIYECATNILKNKKTEAGDLVSELAIFLYDNKDKLEPYIDIKMLEGFSVSWMRIQGQYDNTPFSKKMNINKRHEDIGDEAIIDKIQHMDEIDFDHMNDDEYVKDLRNIYTEEQIASILKIHDIYPNLSKINKILFDAYFLKGLSYDKIKDQYTFFRTKNGKKVYYKSKKSIYNLMIELKNEIKRHL